MLSRDPVLPPLPFAIICLFNKYVLIFYVLHICCIEGFTLFAPGINNSVSQHLLLFLVPDKKECFAISRSPGWPIIYMHVWKQIFRVSWSVWPIWTRIQVPAVEQNDSGLETPDFSLIVLCGMGTLHVSFQSPIT